MTEEAGLQYWAFVSYSHKDAKFGRRLHRSLENYVLPRRVARCSGRQDVLPRRLIPIFRDRDELPAASDLSAEVHASLSRSRSLIVVCSPAAAASKWVGREVEAFRAIHPDRPVFAAVIAGDPAAVIPKSLYRLAEGHLVEPLAADFRREADGPRLALLKLIAGIAGVSLDALVQRDAQRRIRRVTAITAGAFSCMLAMGVLTAFALNERANANRQRAEAEGLVEFMLTDLRSTLKGVGRLDAMTAVNARALRYYRDQNLGALPPDSLERRARVLHAMGEDDEARNDYRSALAKFEEARRTTQALLNAAPDDPDRIFDNAQSEFWIGHVDYMQGRYGEARAAFQNYSKLADEMLARKPQDPRFLREKAYAEGNLCTVYFKPPQDNAAALNSCKAALTYMEKAARRLGTKKLALDLANRHAWLADAYYQVHDKVNERAHRRTQERILQDLILADPKNMQLKGKWIAAQLSLARLDGDDGNRVGALTRLKIAEALSAQMTAFDPSNKIWVRQREAIRAERSEIDRSTSRRKEQ